MTKFLSIATIKKHLKEDNNQLFIWLHKNKLSFNFIKQPENDLPLNYPNRELYQVIAIDIIATISKDYAGHTTAYIIISNKFAQILNQTDLPKDLNLSLDDLTVNSYSY